jgi:hypothetical protein
MNNQEKYKGDLLREYIAPEKTENAPEGFTSKVMTRIELETRSIIVTSGSRRKNLVPAISVAVTILLIASTFLIPGSKSDSLALPALSILKNIKFSMPEIGLSSIFHLTLPSVMIYAILGILVLTVFDRALYGFFHREK